MGNRMSISGTLSDSSQTLANNKQQEQQEWHAYPNHAFMLPKQRNRYDRSGSECSFDSSPSHSEAEAPVVPPRRWSNTTAVLKQQPQQQQKENQEQLQQRPRIQPIVQAGRQVTKDFYWVLPERSRSVRNTPYHNLPLRRSCRSESDQSSVRDYAISTEGAQLLVAEVRKRVIGVTDEECYLALSLHSWDTGKAVRYLMVEQLFRLGVADRRYCIDELKSNDWSLEAACKSLQIRNQTPS